MKKEYANKEDYDDHFWKNNYEVTLSEYGPIVIVNADSEQDALDFAIDYAEEQGYEGLFMTIEEQEEEEFLDDYISGGNHGRYLSSLNVSIHRIK